MAKFTPGPLFVNTARQLAGCNGDIPITTEKGTLIGLAYARMRRPDETLANAHLFAAAPELYEALRELLEVIEENEVIKEYFKSLGTFNEHILSVARRKAHKAIAKAEGRGEKY